MSYCKQQECDKPTKSHGLCRNHARKLKLYGTPDAKLIDHHGRRNSSEYHIYYSMKSRCYKPANKSYDDYGGRGIVVANEWLGIEGFRQFIVDMGPRPSTQHSINRINNDGDYEPSNCEWTIKHRQTSNKRNSNKTVGVSQLKLNNYTYWEAALTVDKVRVFRKAYKSETEAIAARKAAELKYLGYYL